MVKDLVSILVPCYNHEKYIIKALESIKNNDYSLKELIFIDDGSKDCSFEVVNEYLECNKVYFHNSICLKQENQGITRTLNRMVSLSNGEYIVILGSDDYLTERSISDRVEYLKNNPGKKAVIGIAFLVDAADKVLNEDAGKKLYRANSKILASKYINKELIMRWSVAGPTLLLKRSVYDEIGLYNEELQVEDREFYLRLIEKKLLGYINKNVAYYRVHTTNTSQSKSIKKRASLLIEVCNVNILFSKHGFKCDEKCYLSTFRIDRFLIEKKYFNILYIHKAIRIVLCQIYLYFIQLVADK